VAVTRLAVALVALAACRISDVDLTGKHCPCASGYTCNDATQLCQLDGTIDAATDTATDGPSSQSCLTNLPQEMLAFSDTFSSLGAWTLAAGTWVAMNGQAQQTDDTQTLAYAYPSNSSLVVSSYHVVATMHQLDHLADNSAFELAFRIVPATPDMYHCNFEPNDHTLVIQHTSGPQTPVLVSSQVAVGSDYDPNMTITMELAVTGTTATCCVREIDGASVTTTAIGNPNGPPGMKTYRMAAGYGAFQVFH
jgi:hypothetical protein